MKRLSLFIICFLLIFRIPLEYLGNKYSVFNFTLDAFIFMIAFGIILLYFITLKIKYFIDRNTIFIWGFIVVSLISLITSIDFNLSLTAVFSNIFNILCFLLIYKVFNEKQIKTVLISVIIGLSIPLADAYIQFFFGEPYTIKQGYETIRASGFIFKTPAWSAATMVFYLIMVLVFYNYFINGKLYEKMKLIVNKKIVVYVIIALLGIFIIGFRSAILVAMGYFILLAIFSGNITSKIKTFLFAICLLSVGLDLYSRYSPGGFLLLKQAVSPDYLLNPNPGVSTFASRLFYMKKYLFNFNLPIFGYGEGTFGLKNVISDYVSLYVNLWFSYGSLGFFTFILFILKLLKDNLFSKPRIFINSYLVIVILCALVGGLSETTLLGTRGLYFFVLLGIISNRINRYEYNFRESNVYIGNNLYKR